MKQNYFLQCFHIFFVQKHIKYKSIMNESCEKKYERLAFQFKTLLAQTGNQNLSSRRNYERSQTAANDLVNHGFKAGVVRSVLSKMSRSGRPMIHFSKQTGKIKAKYRK